jgi:hypothetical protein
MHVLEENEDGEIITYEKNMQGISNVMRNNDKMIMQQKMRPYRRFTTNSTVGWTDSTNVS